MLYGWGGLVNVNLLLGRNPYEEKKERLNFQLNFIKSTFH